MFLHLMEVAVFTSLPEIKEVNETNGSVEIIYKNERKENEIISDNIK